MNDPAASYRESAFSKNDILCLCRRMVRWVFRVFNPDCALVYYCDLKILAVPTRRDFPILFLDIFSTIYEYAYVR